MRRKVCASCKREVPANLCMKGKPRCRDRAACARARVEWLSAQTFAVGVTRTFG
jgi:hypothetical protein